MANENSVFKSDLAALNPVRFRYTKSIKVNENQHLKFGDARSISYICISIGREPGGDRRCSSLVITADNAADRVRFGCSAAPGYRAV